MATSTTWTTILDYILDKVEDLGYKFTGTSTSGVATTTTTDAELNKGGTAAATARFANAILYIPTGTGVNQIRSVTTISVSGATTTITGLGNFDATYTSVAHYLLALSPDWLRRQGNNALRDITVECMEWLVHGPASANMQGSTVDADWTESGATDTVQTTAAEVAFGQQSLVVTAAGAGDYTQSALAPLGQGRRVRLHGIVKADTGTAILRALDGSGNVQDSIQTTQEDWVYLSKTVSFDSADEQIRLRLVASAASDSLDCNLAGYVKEGIRRFPLPSYLDERFKIKAVCQAIFHEAGSEADTWLYDSMEEKRLAEGEDYRFVSRMADANPHAIVFEPHIDLTQPYYLIIEAPYDSPYGVSTTFTADTSTTYCPLLLIAPYVMMLIGRAHPSTWPGLAEAGEAEYHQRRTVRITAPPLKKQRVRNVF